MIRTSSFQSTLGELPASGRRWNVAVIGAGAAGISAAHRLDQSGLANVVLLEKRFRLGGHVHTHVLPDGPDQGTPVDSGFIVMNDRNYPVLEAFLDELGITPENSDMSFSFSDRATGFEYNGSNLNTLFARRRNLLSPRFIRMLHEIIRFNKQALGDLPNLNPDRTLSDYLGEHAFRGPIVENYLVPMGAAIWSTAHRDILGFPARSFVQFFANHGLLSVNNRPQWKFLPGGSRTYIDAFTRRFGGDIRLQANIKTIRRLPYGQLEVIHHDGTGERFDAVVLAAHADHSLALIERPTDDEARLLGAWSYSKNHTVLHTDPSRMPIRPRAWASWNVIRHPSVTDAIGTQPVHLTYPMNRLQNLRTENPIFVTLNDPAPFRDEDIIAEMTYHHPLYTRAAIESQADLPTLTGAKGLWFCGSYFGYGFHEDAVRSGTETAAALLARITNGASHNHTAETASFLASPEAASK